MPCPSDNRTGVKRSIHEVIPSGPSWRWLVSVPAYSVPYPLLSLVNPASLALHFTQWNPRRIGVLGLAVSFVEIFPFAALLKELFFRGFLQTLISTSICEAERQRFPYCPK